VNHTVCAEKEESARTAISTCCHALTKSSKQQQTANYNFFSFTVTEMCTITIDEQQSSNSAPTTSTNTNVTMLSEIVQGLERRAAGHVEYGEDNESHDRTPTINRRRAWAAMKADSFSCLWNDAEDDDDEHSSAPFLASCNSMQSNFIANAIRGQQRQAKTSSLWLNRLLWGDHSFSDMESDEEDKYLNTSLAELQRSSSSSCSSSSC
jgi:hypothetical protein